MAKAKPRKEIATHLIKRDYSVNAITTEEAYKEDLKKYFNLVEVKYFWFFSLIIFVLIYLFQRKNPNKVRLLYAEIRYKNPAGQYVRVSGGIDWILYKGLRLQESGIIHDTTTSDHFPHKATFIL